MKLLLLCFLLFLSFFKSEAQNQKRNIRFRGFERDSVILPLNDEYYLIEDSCAQIVRYAHYNNEQRKFQGKFKDVSKLDSNLVVSEGNYTADGIKDGEFVSRYLNGKLRAKGRFKNGKYDGKWETFYDNGKPELTFEVTGNDVNVISEWKADGTQMVTNGAGAYLADMGTLYWKGKLFNGKPDGTWDLVRTDDISNTALATEHFKKGQFIKGNRGDVEYSDASHIVLVSTTKLSFTNAEKMMISSVPCNGGKSKHVVSAQYINGSEDFAAAIGDVVAPYLSRMNLSSVNRTVFIEGEISEKGNLIEMKSPSTLKDNLALGLIQKMRQVPVLHPATVDGVPVKQKFNVSFTFQNGYYQISYTFLPIQLN